MDYPYILNYFILLILAYLYWKKPDPKLVKWAFFLEFVFIAFRAPVVGADTWNYVRYLDGERNFYNYDNRELESGFLLYRKLLVSMHPSRLVVMIINSLLSCFPIYLLIKRYSYNVPLSLALLPLFKVYSLYFVGLRQILGLAVIFLGILYVLAEKKGKWLVFFTLAILGYYMHTTIALYAVIFFIVYYVRLNSRSLITILIVASAIIGIILKTFNVTEAFNLFLSLNVSTTERIEGYMYSFEDANIEASINALQPTLFATLAICFIDEKKINHWITNIYVVGVILGNLFVSVPMLNRILVGFSIFGTIVFSWIFYESYKFNKLSLETRKWLCIIFLLYCSISYIRQNMNSRIDYLDAGRMHPYLYIWEDYSKHPSIKYF